MSDSRISTRRQFVKSTTAATASLVCAPAIHAASKAGSATMVGSGEHQYRVQHMWPQLPSKFTWQTTHNVAFDSEGLLYVIHEGRFEQKDHPTIFVFDPEGKYVRSFGSEYHGGGHGIEIRNEGGQDYLYVCLYHQQRSIAKVDTRGEQVWRKGAPMESGLYLDGEQYHPREKDDNPWGRDRFMPTNIAFHSDGGFYLADGYGAFCIHRYDKDANWLEKFGSTSTEKKEDGKFNLPHGIWIDDRNKAEPLVVVADRANARLQWFTLAGGHRQTMDDFLLPANIDTFGDVMLVPDLLGRVTLLDGENKVIAHLGDDSKRIQADANAEENRYQIRQDESKWQDGKFVHPHDACFDTEGNIFVAEWVHRGRVSKLSRV